MGPGVGALRRGPVPKRMSDENHHDCTGPPWVMRPQCLHARAAPAGVLVCPAGRPGEVSLPSVASPPRAGGGTGSGRRAPLVCAPPPLTGVCVTRLLGAGGCPPPPPAAALESSGWLCASPGGAAG